MKKHFIGVALGLTALVGATGAVVVSSRSASDAASTEVTAGADVVAGKAQAPSPLDSPFRATVMVENVRADGESFSETYEIDFHSSDDWRMVVVETSSPPDGPGQAPNPVGTMTVSERGFLRTYTEPQYSIADLGIDPAQIGEIQKELGSSGQEIIDTLIAEGKPEARRRLLDEISLEPGERTTPMPLFDLRATENMYEPSVDGPESTMRFTGSDRTPHDEVIYSSDGIPLSAASYPADGRRITIAVTSFERLR